MKSYPHIEIFILAFKANKNLINLKSFLMMKSSKIPKNKNKIAKDGKIWLQEIKHNLNEEEKKIIKK